MKIPADKLNIGVVGLGRIGKSHALNILHRVPRARLHCVCSVATHEIQWAKEALQPEGVSVYAEFDEMIRTPSLDAMIIASPTALHVEHTMVAIANGVHVLCEKPITTELPVVSPTRKRNP